MLLTGKIEVFKGKKGYLVGKITGFDQDKKPTGHCFIDVKIADEKLSSKIVDGKTLTLDVELGYLNVRHVELETESFDKLEYSIKKAKVVSVFPEEKKATKKSKK